ncbi:MAG: ribonuclease P protein component [Oscillospiraceae bacterium]|nr:ribonuclease P protein component [Christensenellales bacterium]HIR69479.1 ribonuclease P protein component [Candidatus Pelethousia gallinarum]
MKRCFSLKRNKQFRQVYRKGKSVACRELVLIYAKNRSDMVHVGFSVGKKLGNSVVRNRVKRRLREAFRPNLPLLLPGFDLIVIARDAARDAPFSSLADSLRYLLRKAGLFQKPKRP